MGTVQFITGTDTGVGKTVVTGWLALQAAQQGKTVAVYKPIQTGSPCVEMPEDPCTVARYVSTHGYAVNPVCWSAPPTTVTSPVAVGYTYSFEPPVTPAVADTHQTIQWQTLVSIAVQLASQVDVLLIEGAGGLLVPLAPQLDTLALITRLYQALPQLTCTVVARPNLGTINHTRLTVGGLANFPIDRVIVSNYPPETLDLAIKTLPDMLAAWLSVPVTYLPPLPA